jgi:hypothetical protein
MTTVPKRRLGLLRKLAELDQEISAGELWLTANRRDCPEADLVQETLRDRRLTAERIVILLRRTAGD